MEQCYTTVHLLTNYQRYFSLNLRCMTFFLLQHHSNAVLIDFHYYIYPKFNICTLFSVFVSDNTANRFCTVPSKNSNDLLLGGASGNVNILMFNRTLVDNANRDTSNNRSFFEYYGVIHI